MDRLLSIEIFVESAQAGSFTKASEKFGITPAMIGKHIKRLEQHAGVVLLNRSTRKQTLTEAGKEYLICCHKILNHYTDLEQKMSNFNNSPTGNLRISAPVTFGSLALSPILCDFLDLYPNLNIELELSDQKVDVTHGGFDIIFRIGELDDASYIARKVCDYDLIFCASPKYLNTRSIPNTLSDLKKHKCLSFAYRGSPSTLASEIETDAFDLNNSQFSSNNGMALKKAAIKGWGILLQPKMLVNEELESGSLVEVLVNSKPKPRPVHMLYKSRENKTLKSDLFITYLTQCKWMF